MYARLRSRLMSKALIGVLLALMLTPVRPAPARAESQSGGVVDPSTILGMGTRPASMGNAFVALSDDATSVFWNPAALDMARRKELFGQYSQAFFDNTAYNMLAYKHPLGRFGTLGGGLIIEGVDDLTRRDVNANNIGAFNVSKMNAMFSYGKQMTDGFYLGSTLHILRHQIDGFSGTGFGLDAAALYRFTNRYVEYSRAYLRLAREQIGQDAQRLYTLGMRAYETGRNADAFEQFLLAVETDPSDKAARKMLLVTAQKDQKLMERARAKKLTNGHASMAEFIKTHSANGDPVKNLRVWFEEGVKLYDEGRLKESIPFFEAVIRHARSNYITDRLSLGMNVQNLLQPSIKLKSTADKSPTNVKLGAAYRVTDWLQFALDVDFPTKGEHRIHFGVEWRPIDWLAFRAGLDHDNPTFGLGFKYQDLKVDYAFVPSSDLDNDFQRVSLSYEFGKSQGDITSERIQRGLTMAAKKDYASAKKEWESAQELAPEHPLPRKYIQESDAAYRAKVTDPWTEASRHLAAGRLMEAETLIRSILTFDPAFDPALRAAEQIRAQVPSYVESRFKAGYLDFLKGDYAAARDEFARALYFQPGHVSAEPYMAAARKFFETSERERAIRELYKDGLDQYRAGRWSEAAARLQSVLRRHATHPTAASLVEQIANFQEAEFLPEERALESERFFRIAKAQYLDDYVLRAEVSLSHSLALDPKNAEAQALLSRIEAQQSGELIAELVQGDDRFARGDVDKAVEAWRKVLESDPGNFDARRRLESAIDDIRTFIETMNRDGWRLEAEGVPTEALRRYNRTLLVDPFNPAAAARREALRAQSVAYVEKAYREAESYYQSGELEKSISLLSDLIAIDPELSGARDLQELARQKFEEHVTLARMRRLYKEGMAYAQNRNFEQAISAWQEIVSEESAHPEIAAMAADARQNMDAAIRELERDRNASFAAEFLRTGDEHLAAGRPIDALQAFRHAQELTPENEQIRWRIESARNLVADRAAGWLAEGRTALSEGRLDDADVYFQAVLGVDPQNADASAGIRDVKRTRIEGAPAAQVESPVPAPISMQDDVENRKAANEIAELMTRAGEYRRKAALAERQGRIDLAISRSRSALETYRDVLLRNPAESTAKSAARDLESGIARLEKLWKEKKSGDVRRHLYSGMGHYRAGRLNEAIADWNRVIAIDRSNDQAREYIRRAEKKLELIDQSRSGQ
ncbi:tetratricopeptide repeat protein [bacterium]|nr:tetratricopeptide repeat protein [bacterium]